MKKLLLSAAAVALSMGAFAQFQLKSNEVKWGYEGSIILDDSLRRVQATFDADSTVVPFAAVQSFRGMMGTALTYDVIPGTNTYFNGGRGLNIENRKSQATNTNANPYKFRSVAELLDTCRAKAIPNPYNYNSSWEAWKSGAYIFKNGVVGEKVTNNVFAYYPGMNKNILLGFRTNFKGVSLASDVSFDVLTYSRGNLVNNSGVQQYPAIKYKMIVTTTGTAVENLKAAQIDTMKVGNGTDTFIFEDVYITSTTEDQKVETINVFQKIGKDKEFFNNKEVSVYLYTVGTLGVYPSLPGGYYDPFIAIDNVKTDYIMPQVLAPSAFIPGEGGTNWRPDMVANNDTASVPRNDEWTDVKFKVATKDRTGALQLVEKTKSINVYFPADAAKTKDANGDYTVDVPVTITNSTAGGNLEDRLSIAAPAQGTKVDDDLEITVKVRGTSADVDNLIRTVLYETTIGNAFEVNINLRYKGVEGTSSVGAPANNAIQVISVNRNIKVLNTVERVNIYNVSGQLIQSVSANQAAKGIAVSTGVYLVKTGEHNQKVVVK